MDVSLRAYVELSLVPGVGPKSIERLLEHFGSAEAVLNARRSQLREVPGIGFHLADSIRQRDRGMLAQVLQDCSDRQIEILTRIGPGFPRLLGELTDAPLLLFLRGTLVASDQLSLAIVGTRHATTYGKQQAERFARSLSKAGFTIVSGLARGIDTAVHQATLEQGGRTIAFLGNGLSEVFPPENKDLAERIVAEGGALISESPPHTKPKKGMFPQRNRLISGMSLGLLVIEAAERSGALITARHAGEQGREVFALPGNVTSRVSSGCHRLIRDGATLVQNPEEIIEQLGPLVEDAHIAENRTVRRPAELQLNSQEEEILQSIDFSPTDIDLLVLRCKLPVQRILSTLSALEMRHLVRRAGGRSVQRC